MSDQDLNALRDSEIPNEEDL
ncbi:MAG: hypothetical protein RIS43_981, partial [Actinomycetota bacterium]